MRRYAEPELGGGWVNSRIATRMALQSPGPSGRTRRCKIRQGCRLCRSACVLARGIARVLLRTLQRGGFPTYLRTMVRMRLANSIKIPPEEFNCCIPYYVRLVFQEGPSLTQTL